MGSLSKKTWLRKKEVRVHWASSCPGPQWCSRSELVSSCFGPGSDLFTVTPWHLESAVLITSLHTFPWPDVTYWTMGELLFWAPSSSSGEVCLDMSPTPTTFTRSSSPTRRPMGVRHALLGATNKSNRLA